MSNKLYDILKHTAAIVLPIVNALYFGLAQIWHFSDEAEVMGTIGLINALVGTIFGISVLSYGPSYAGDLQVEPDENGRPQFSMSLNTTPEAVAASTNATFKVKQISSGS